MKMSITFSPSKVLIKKFMGRSFWIRYLLPCIFCFYVSFFFFQFDLDSVIGLTATRQWPLKSLWMGLRHASRQDHTVLNQIGKTTHYVCSYIQYICLGCETLYKFYSFIPCLSILIYTEYNITEWITPYLDSIKNHKKRHVFKIVRNTTNQKARLFWKRWSTVNRQGISNMQW